MLLWGFTVQTRLNAASLKEKMFLTERDHVRDSPCQDLTRELTSRPIKDKARSEPIKEQVREVR